MFAAPAPASAQQYSTGMVVLCLVVCFGLGAYFAFDFIKGLRTGVVEFGGNSRSTRRQSSYSRLRSPGMYWFGIVMYSVFAVGLLGFGIYFAVTQVSS